MAGVLREAWSGRVLDYLTTADDDSFLQGVDDVSQYVANVGDEAQVIHLVNMGVLPAVLINNTTYPIPVTAQTESDVPVTLDKYQTEVTPITDDELYALSYNKMDKVRSRHGLAIQIKKTQKAIHALAPASNTTAMPVLLTTGADDGTGRKRCTWQDVANLKAKMDALLYPKEGRRLVLCPDHENDLIVPNQLFAGQYYNRPTGQIFNQMGFEIFSYGVNPYYRPSTLAKLSFGATPLSTDRMASVAFMTQRAVKAIGWVKMYFLEAKMSPQQQRNEINFRHNFIVLPTEEAARGAIVSSN